MYFEVDDTEEDKPVKKTKYSHLHCCKPVKGVDFSGASRRRQVLQQQVCRGNAVRRTVTVALPLSEDKAAGESNVLRILIDTGSDGDLFFPSKKTLDLYDLVESAYPVTWGTSNGKFKTTKKAKLRLLLTEFSQERIFEIMPDVKVVKEKREVTYDLIIGIETLANWDCVLDFKKGTMSIDDVTVPMRESESLDDDWLLMNTYRESVEPLATKEETARVTRILDAKYEPADLPKVVEENCAHLSSQERKALLNLLRRYEDMFQGDLGKWVGDEVHFDLKPGSKPFNGRAYPVPKVHGETIRKEVRRLCEIGVLEPVEGEDCGEWGSPSFIIAKSNGTVRFLTDFRELNKCLVRKPYPIPKIAETLQQMEKFSYCTAVDLNMGYYHLVLDLETRKICTIVFPWGKYRYVRLPMGAACAPDIFQARMNSIFNELEYVLCYIDDLLIITTGDFVDHLEKIEVVLRRLHEKGFQVNAAKSNFCALEVDYLGYTLTRDGIRPQRKKVDAILALKPPKNVKELRRVLGIVQYYRDIWEKRTDILAPLTDLVAECGTTKKKKVGKPWRWEDEHDAAFRRIKEVIARDVVLAYPDFSKKFVIYTDASKRQLGGVITQDNRIIAFFSRKLTKAQTKYSVTELELLSIVELLKEFKGMLLGFEVEVWTDHINLTYENLGQTSDRVLRWRLLLEEYNVTLKYIKGENNTVADAISRLDYCPRQNPHAEDGDAFDKSELNVHRRLKECSVFLSHLHYRDDPDESEQATNEENPAPKQTWAHNIFAQSIAAEEDEIYPVTIAEIAQEQRVDKKWKKFFDKPSGKSKKPQEKDIKKVVLEGTEVLCKVSPRKGARPRLVIPSSLQSKVLDWMHLYLQHPGRDRMENTLRSTMYWRDMSTQIRKLCRTCDRCQLAKKRKVRYGHLPAKQADYNPWETVCVDLIGPYTIRGEDGSCMDFMCMTMIDPASGWFEMDELPVCEVFREGKKEGSTVIIPDEVFDKTAAQCSRILNKTWLSRYPRPKQVICDNGSEFKGDFAELLKSYSVKRKPTTVKNPQANAILERTHGVFGDMMRTSGINNGPTVDSDVIADFITNAAWAIRSTYHYILKASPGEAIFGRNMLFDIPFIADWCEIGRSRQKLVDRSNERENKSRIPFDYKVGSKAMIVYNLDGSPMPKAKDKNEGPYLVTEVYTNGTVRLQRGSVSERINIRRLTPYFEE